MKIKEFTFTVVLGMNRRDLVKFTATAELKPEDDMVTEGIKVIDLVYETLGYERTSAQKTSSKGFKHGV